MVCPKGQVEPDSFEEKSPTEEPRAISWPFSVVEGSLRPFVFFREDLHLYLGPLDPHDPTRDRWPGEVRAK